VLRMIFLCLILFTSPASQAQQRNCDHAAPPPGMHYVCDPANPCNCHLEEDQLESEKTAKKPPTTPCVSDLVKYFVVPNYPTELWRKKKQGTVKLQLTVGSTGTAVVKLESGDAPFADEVTEALKKWKFVPTNPPQTLSVSVTFMLAGTPSADLVTTVSGTSPLELVISATPPLR
jgi:TonB family protein